jgi:hypothetical protein
MNWRFNRKHFIQNKGAAQKRQIHRRICAVNSITKCLCRSQPRLWEKGRCHVWPQIRVKLIGPQAMEPWPWTYRHGKLANWVGQPQLAGCMLIHDYQVYFNSSHTRYSVTRQLCRARTSNIAQTRPFKMCYYLFSTQNIKHETDYDSYVTTIPISLSYTKISILVYVLTLLIQILKWYGLHLILEITKKKPKKSG